MKALIYIFKSPNNSFCSSLFDINSYMLLLTFSLCASKLSLANLRLKISMHSSFIFLLFSSKELETKLF